MHPKIKSRATGDSTEVASVKPIMLHDVAKQAASANAASRHKIVATQPASGTANHARHHVARQTQS
jgi:hypothetical protein